MLSKIGKLAVLTVLAGGMLLTGSDAAEAGTLGTIDCGGVPSYPVPCDAQTEATACGDTAGYWYIENGHYWCPEYYGNCTMWCNSGDINYQWSITHYDNDDDPCPPTLPCS
jgi:hypothetical protein